MKADWMIAATAMPPRSWAISRQENWESATRIFLHQFVDGDIRNKTSRMITSNACIMLVSRAAWPLFRPGHLPAPAALTTLARSPAELTCLAERRSILLRDVRIVVATTLA